MICMILLFKHFIKSYYNLGYENILLNNICFNVLMYIILNLKLEYNMDNILLIILL